MEKSLLLYLGPQSQAYKALKDIEMRYLNIEMACLAAMHLNN